MQLFANRCYHFMYNSQDTEMLKNNAGMKYIHILYETLIVVLLTQHHLFLPVAAYCTPPKSLCVCSTLTII